MAPQASIASKLKRELESKLENMRGLSTRKLPVSSRGHGRNRIIEICVVECVESLSLKLSLYPLETEEVFEYGEIYIRVTWPPKTIATHIAKSSNCGLNECRGIEVFRYLVHIRRTPRIPYSIREVIADSGQRAIRAAEHSEWQTCVKRDNGVDLPIVKDRVLPPLNIQSRNEVVGGQLVTNGLIEICRTPGASEIKRIGRPRLSFIGSRTIVDCLRPGKIRQQREPICGAASEIELQGIVHLTNS